MDTLDPSMNDSRKWGELGDNPKCFALEASDFEPILNPMFERFAARYGGTIECLPPRDPQKKGKVEQQMPHVPINHVC